MAADKDEVPVPPEPFAMRVQGWVVVPRVFMDNGEDLIGPLGDEAVQPQFIPLSKWQAFKDGGDDAALAELKATLGAAVMPPIGRELPPEEVPDGAG